MHDEIFFFKRKIYSSKCLCNSLEEYKIRCAVLACLPPGLRFHKIHLWHLNFLHNKCTGIKCIQHATMWCLRHGYFQYNTALQVVETIPSGTENFVALFGCISVNIMW